MISALALTMSQFLQRGSLLLAIAVVVLACDAHSAWAACGDHLHRVDAGALEISEQSIPIEGPACSGPQCSRHLPTSTIPGKAVDIPTPADVILTSIVSMDDGFNRSGARHLHQEHVMNGPADVLFKPPRR